MEFDHLVVAAETLEAGADHVEAALGVRPGPGGKHPDMGTHNLLLSLGPSAYLEVIAIDPVAAAPDHARWFDLDRFSGPPRLTSWVARCDDLEAALAAAPPMEGRIRDLARGDLRWRMLVLDDGRLPFDGLYPGLIRWQGTGHPAAQLPDSGICIERLVLHHPRAEALRAALPLPGMEHVEVVHAERPGLEAHLRTAGGRVRLGGGHAGGQP